MSKVLAEVPLPLTSEDNGTQEEAQEEQSSQPSVNVTVTQPKSAPKRRGRAPGTKILQVVENDGETREIDPREFWKASAPAGSTSCTLERIGPKIYPEGGLPRFQKPVQCGQCGPVPDIDPAHLATYIYEQFGGGTYLMRWQTKEGAQTSVPIRIAGKPKDIHPEAPEQPTPHFVPENNFDGPPGGGYVFDERDLPGSPPVGLSDPPPGLLYDPEHGTFVPKPKVEDPALTELKEGLKTLQETLTRPREDHTAAFMQQLLTLEGQRAARETQIEENRRREERDRFDREQAQRREEETRRREEMREEQRRREEDAKAIRAAEEKRWRDDRERWEREQATRDREAKERLEREERRITAEREAFQRQADMQRDFANTMIQLVATKNSDSASLSETVQTVASLASLFAGNEHVQLLQAIAQAAPAVSGSVANLVSGVAAQFKGAPTAAAPPAAPPQQPVQPKLPAPQPAAPPQPAPGSPLSPNEFLDLLNLCVDAANTDKSPNGVVAVLQMKAPLVLKSLADIADPLTLATNLDLVAASRPDLKEKAIAVATLCRDEKKSEWFAYFLGAAHDAVAALAVAAPANGDAQ